MEAKDWMTVAAIFSVVGIPIGAAVMWPGLKRRLRLEDAECRYKNSLGKLTRNPANTKIKQEALERGRHYLALSRSETGVPSLDEVALMEEINTACNSAMLAERRGVLLTSMDARLAELEKIHTIGIVRKEENDKKV